MLRVQTIELAFQTLEMPFFALSESSLRCSVLRTTSLLTVSYGLSDQSADTDQVHVWDGVFVFRRYGSAVTCVGFPSPTINVVLMTGCGHFHGHLGVLCRIER